MKAWLSVPYHGENIAGEYQIVYERHRATEMSNGNAQQMKRAAETAFTGYIWRMVPVGKFFIVEGTKKEKK